MLTSTTHQKIAAVCRLFGWPVPTPDMPGADMLPAQILDHMLGDALSLLHVLVLEQSGIRDGDGWRRRRNAVESAVFALDDDCARYVDESEALTAEVAGYQAHYKTRAADRARAMAQAEAEARAADPTAFDGRDTSDDGLSF
jgi:hypothetical protein